MASKLLLGRLTRLLKPRSIFPTSFRSTYPFARFRDLLLLQASKPLRRYFLPSTSRNFSSPSSDLDTDFQGPATIDYRSLLQEEDFHRLADSTIHALHEKVEEYGDNVQIDGFDIDYGNEVLTIKLGDLGTYVLNKQSPNRQLWLSSPVSGPSRFDWDWKAQAWIYRRTKANLLVLLESELQQLCGEPIKLA